MDLRQAIEQVTDPSQTIEDWATMMKICDDVAIHTQSAEEAMKAIRNKLQTKSSSQGWRSIALTLTLLEALVKNCGEIFHIQLANEDFLRTLKSLIAPTNNTPLPIQERLLEMIQYWAFAFTDDPGLHIITEFYQVCKEQGFQFPLIDKQHVIKSSLPTETRSKHPIPSKTTSLDTNSHEFNINNSAVIRHLPDEQIAKLRSELDLVHINLDVFEQMLAHLDPGYEHPDDWELFSDLYKTSKQMQARVVSLLSVVAIDDIAVDFLRCNDRINRVFNDYKLYMEKREEVWKPLAPHLEIMKNDRESLSRATKRPTHNFNDDFDSSENENQIITSSTDTITPTKKYQRHSAEEHDDQSLLTAKLQNIRLTPLPHPVPRSTDQVTISKRASSAAGTVRIARSRSKPQIHDDDEEKIEDNENIQSTNENDHHDNANRTTLPRLPSRVKRLSTDNNDSLHQGYKITGYHHLESDSNK